MGDGCAERPDAPGAAPVVARDGFRVLATATELPREAAGPWLDRFRRFAVGPLGEACANELLLGLAGRAPARVVVDDAGWRGLTVEPAFARLAAARDLEAIASTIARVHAGVVAAATSPGWRGGARPSRRCLLRVLRDLERRGHDPLSLRRALAAAYVDGAPSRAVAALIDAAAPLPGAAA